MLGMTNNYNPDQKRGGPANAGNWTKYENSNPEGQLPQPAPTATQRRLAELNAGQNAARMVESAAHRVAMDANTEILELTIQEAFPAATHAVFFRPWDANDDDMYELHSVYTGNDLIFDKEGAATDPERRSEIIINKVLGEYGDDASEYLGYIGELKEIEELSDLEDNGNVLSIKVNSGDKPVSLKISDAVGINRMSRKHLNELANDAGESLGKCVGWVGKDDIEYRLTEDSQFDGFAPDTMSKLEAKFGDREKALTAIVESAAWADLDETLNEQTIRPVVRGLNRAVKELLE